MMLKNPFVVSGYQGPEYFCDREKETATLIKLIENGNNVVLMSPRRIGKTGLLYHTFNQEEIRNNYNTFLIDIYSTGTLPELVASMGRAILSQLMSKGERAMAKFTSIVSSLRPTMTFDLMGKPSWSIDTSSVLSPEFSLEQIFKYLEESEKPNIVAIDEFQQITNYPEKNVEAILRTHIQRSSNTHWVFSGSSYHLLSEMFTSAARPFYNSTSSMNLTPISLDKYSEFSMVLFAKNDKELDSMAVASVYSKFEGVTWYMQKMMNQLFANTSPQGKCSEDMVTAALSQILDENSQLYADLLYQLTQRQKELLVAIAKEGKASAITGSKFIKKYHLNTPSTVQTSISFLINKQLVTKSNNQYEVYDKFFALWLASKYVF